MDLNQALIERAQHVIPGGVNSPVRAFGSVGGAPRFIERAKGPYMWDVTDKRFTDYVCSWGPMILGHNDPEVVEAVHAAVDRGLSFGAATRAEVEIAEMITNILPAMEEVRLVSSGTEAGMSAIRLARGYTGRNRIIKFEGCYHGHSDALLVKAGSGLLTFGNPSSAGVPASVTEHTMVLEYNNPEQLEDAFAKYGDEIACVIVEAFAGNMNLVRGTQEFIDTMRRLCTKHGALLIVDEVMTGFRVAPGGVQQLYGITPDLTCMGKVIGGGLPVGAFGGRSEIMDCLSPLGPVYQAGTLSGNPVAMAAGLAQLRELLEGNAYERLEQLGARMEEGIREALKKHGRNYTFHRAGSMFCLFFTEEEVYNLESAQKASKKLFKSFFWNMLEQGVYFAPSPYETGFISTAHTEEDIDRTVEAVRISLSRLG